MPVGQHQMFSTAVSTMLTTVMRAAKISSPDIGDQARGRGGEKAVKSPPRLLAHLAYLL